jgi:hypothetical protein
MELLYLIKDFFGIKEKRKKESDDSIKVTITYDNDPRCICERNRGGESLMGWCQEHHTDWF